MYRVNDPYALNPTGYIIVNQIYNVKVPTILYLFSIRLEVLFLKLKEMQGGIDAQEFMQPYLITGMSVFNYVKFEAFGTIF